MSYSNYCLHVGILDNLNGFQLKSIEPNERGFFPMVIGCLGVPTRGKIVYDIQSTIDAMKDVTTRFNICLRDGNLCGEYGHPVIEKKEDMPRLLRIDEHYKSHYFGGIWTDDPITVNGQEAIPIRALVKPTGPYADTLERELRDPYHNTAFSIRTLCLPMDGPNPEYSYRKVQLVITFDAVHAPGFDITSKRYVSGQESFSELGIKLTDLENAITRQPMGMESLSMITDADIRRIKNDKQLTINGDLVATNIVGAKSIMDINGNLRSAASLVYGRR